MTDSGSDSFNLSLITLTVLSVALPDKATIAMPNSLIKDMSSEADLKLPPHKSMQWASSTAI